MRTIDPFFAPGLWGGAPMPPQSPMMAGGLPDRVASPPKAAKVTPAVIVSSYSAHGSLASLNGSKLAAGFHAWRGRSGKRVICSVFQVSDGAAHKGLPDFTHAIVIGVDDCESDLYVRAVFALDESEDRYGHIEAAVSMGVTQWHVHLPEGGEAQCAALLRDLQY